MSTCILKSTYTYIYLEFLILLRFVTAPGSVATPQLSIRSIIFSFCFIKCSIKCLLFLFLLFNRRMFILINLSLKAET